MNEKTLMKLSLAGAVIGICALFFVTSHLNTPHVNIGEIDLSFVSREVNISGTVKNLYRHADGHVFFDLEDDSGTIKIVLWDSTVRALSTAGFAIEELAVMKRLEIVGSVELYQGELEVIPLRGRVRFI